MAKEHVYLLKPDKKGVVWDLLLYVPTVFALALIGIKLWYSGKEVWGYLLEFLATFFFLVGANRVAARLQWSSKSPVELRVSKNHVVVGLKNGEKVDLVKEVKFYSDYAGKSFGVSGVDGMGVKRQYVFHKGQFEDDSFREVRSALRVYA